MLLCVSDGLVMIPLEGITANWGAGKPLAMENTPLGVTPGA